MTRDAMGDERRWAARYQFLEGLWRGRDRIIFDPELEQALHGGVEDAGGIGRLLAALIPDADGDARVWMPLANERRAAAFARQRSGTIFADLDDAGELASEEPWEVALVSVPEGEVDARLETMLELLGERVEDSRGRRSVALMTAIGDDEDRAYERLADLVDEQFGDGRIYGLSRSALAAFYDFGPVIEAEGGAEDKDELPEIEVDNSLGPEEPAFEVFVAVIGDRLPSEGVTFVELEAAGQAEARASGAPARPSPSADEVAALKAQLAEAQRRGDLQAIQRQELLEQLEQAEDRIASLEEESERTGEVAGRVEDRAAEAEERERLDAVLAREQTLRWRVAQLESEAESLRARPVEELEAELAAARARVAELELEDEDTLVFGAEEAADAEDEAEVDEFEDEDLEALEGDFEALRVYVEADDEPSAAELRAWKAARGRVDQLLRKLERGNRVSALELHRELRALRELF